MKAIWCHSFVAPIETSPGNDTSLTRDPSYKTHFTLLLSKRRERIRRAPALLPFSCVSKTTNQVEPGFAVRYHHPSKVNAFVWFSVAPMVEEVRNAPFVRWIEPTFSGVSRNPSDMSGFDGPPEDSALPL